MLRVRSYIPVFWLSRSIESFQIPNLISGTIHDFNVRVQWLLLFMIITVSEFLGKLIIQPEVRLTEGEIREILWAPDKSAYVFIREKLTWNVDADTRAHARQVRQTEWHSFLLPFEANDAAMCCRECAALRMRSYSDRIPFQERETSNKTNSITVCEFSIGAIFDKSYTRIYEPNKFDFQIHSENIKWKYEIAAHRGV